MEQNSIGYVYPDEILRSNDCTQHRNAQSTNSMSAKQKSPDNSWQIVIPVSPKSSSDQSEDSLEEFQKIEAANIPEQQPGNASTESSDLSMVPSTSGIIPAAARRLLSLKDMGAKKIGALKLKLIENNARINERGDFNGMIACRLSPI